MCWVKEPAYDKKPKSAIMTIPRPAYIGQWAFNWVLVEYALNALK